MPHRFVSPNSPILIKKAEKVVESAVWPEQVQKAFESMLSVAYGEQKDRSKPVMVGLAAPQLGISKRIILVDVAADGKGNVGDLRVYINPEIVWKSKEENEWYEGCYSTGRVCGVVSRPTKIRVKAWDKNGRTVEEAYSGYTARIFQHEIDHLDGKVFVDHIVDDSKLHWVEENEFADYRNNEKWRTWQKRCSREKWKRMQSTREK